MADIADGVNATALVWLRLLQLQTMRPQDKYHELGNKWFAEYGVSRYAKSDALKVLKRQGLIHVRDSTHHGPRVAIVPRSKRRVSAQVP
jgi:hypothetical protein